MKKSKSLQPKTYPILCKQNRYYCLYIKLYARPEVQDEILKEEIAPLLERVKKIPFFHHFFFIRYADPEDHLRLRFFGNWQFVHQEPRKQILEMAKRISTLKRLKYTLAYYRPEWERYGGKFGVRIAEQIFDYNSNLVLKFLQSSSTRNNSWSKIEFSLASIEILLSALGFSLKDRDHWYYIWSGGLRCFLNERFQDQVTAKKITEPLAKSLQSSVHKITQNLWGYCQHQDGALLDALKQFYNNVKTVSKEIILKKSLISAPLGTLARSYVHMHFNRLGINLEEEGLIIYIRAWKGSNKSVL